MGKPLEFDLTKLETIAESVWGVARTLEFLEGKIDRGSWSDADQKRKGKTVDHVLSLATSPEKFNTENFSVNSVALGLLKAAGY